MPGLMVLERGRIGRWALQVFCVSLLLSCSGPSDQLGFDYRFSTGPQGWVAGFADYRADDEESFALVAAYLPLPEPLDASRSALYIAGSNHSDDLWMYHKVQNVLPPDTSYRVTFRVQIATNVPMHCVGPGSPGESVYVKAGVSVGEPDRFLDDLRHWRMNVDKGNQSSAGEDALVIGDIANSQECGAGPRRWEIKTLSSGSESISFTTDGSGVVWLFVGTDSGFEGRSEVYYTRFVALFDRL